MSDKHDHDDDGAHHTEPPSPAAARAQALESLLLEKGLVTVEAIDRVVEAYEKDIGPLIGARVVARAWTDAGFKRRLLVDAPAAIHELGIGGLFSENLVVVENRKDLHNVIVCTLCSCYPWALLGLPPSWYKDPRYRARIVVEPRHVLADLGLTLEEDTRIAVWDSSAETRYLVLPERPPGTEEMTEEQLAALVTRDAMVGVAQVRR